MNHHRFSAAGGHAPKRRVLALFVVRYSHFPSGEKAEANPPFSVTCCGSPPEAGIFQSCVAPELLEEK